MGKWLFTPLSSHRDHCANENLSYTHLQSRQYCVISVAMLAAALILLSATLALFGYIRYRRAGFRINPDIWTLRDDVDGLMKREASHRASERAKLRRQVDEDTRTDHRPDIAPPGSGPLGGVVKRSETQAPAARRA